MTYKLVFGRPDTQFGPANFTVIYTGTVEECAKRRQVAGDIVVDENNVIVQGDEWLFPWERNDPDCYVRKMQRMGWIY